MTMSRRSDAGAIRQAQRCARASLAAALLLCTTVPLAAQTEEPPERFMVSASAGAAFATERDLTVPVAGGRVLWKFDDLHALVLDARLGWSGGEAERPGC